MNDSNALIIFAFVALAAVFAFILVLGSIPAEVTGNLSANQRIGTSWFKERDARMACSRGQTCADGLPAIPTGRYDEARELWECVCQTTNTNFIMYRSNYQVG